MIRKVLVVGGGIGGMAAAIELGRRGIAVDLVDLDPHWRVYGAGITITSPTLRAFGDLGILDAVLRDGFSGNGIRICTMEGVPVDEVADPPGMPGSGGIMRPILHRILSERTLEIGTNVRLGCTVSSMDEDEHGAAVVLSDGSNDRYDLVIGADGLNSAVRGLTFPDAPKPAYTGQSVWRLFAKRPAEFDRRHFFLGGKVKIGIAPVSQDSLYLFLLEKTPRHPMIPDAELPAMMAALMQGYGGIVGRLRDELHDASPIVMRPLEAFVLPGAWHTDRVLLIGDAAHPTTPQLASGAGMAVEDAVVLGREIDGGGEVPEILRRYQARRDARCRLVVENSLEIGRLEQAGAPPSEQTRLVAQSLARLAEPV
ncbi:FAD-dependent monooxygenase [Sphingomonas sp. NFX23]|uniref:FAD-dependent monooxygenase n=1 Tax=Sphingomonas sp. NFX23 TaxID=2819532 RepID=UPI003CE8830D